MQTELSPELAKELRKRMSLIRLAKTGLFKKMNGFEDSNDLIANIKNKNNWEWVDISRDLFLHRAVLDKALIDSFSPHEELRKEVEDWLNLSNEEFIGCCERAMLPPPQVYEIFKLMKTILRGKNAKFKEFGSKKDNNDED